MSESEIDMCRVWTSKWAESMPDPVVADQVEDDDGMVDPDCLPEERLESMVESGELPEEFHPDPPEEEQEEEPPEDSSGESEETEVTNE